MFTTVAPAGALASEVLCRRAAVAVTTGSDGTLCRESATVTTNPLI